MEFDQLRRLLDGLAAELADDGEVSNLVAVLHGTVLQLELLVEDVDVVVAVELNFEHVLVELDVVTDNAVCLLEAKCEVDEGDLDVDALCLTHFPRDAVDGNCFIGKRNIGRQLDDVVKHLNNLLRLGVEQDAAELDDMRPGFGECFNWQFGLSVGSLGRQSGGFSVKYENEHFWLRATGKISLERKYKKDFNFLRLGVCLHVCHETPLSHICFLANVADVGLF